MSIDRRNVRGLARAIAYDVRGSRLGRVVQVFLDDRTDEPAWVAVDVTRTRGMRLLPLAGSGLKGRYLVIRAERARVRSAPRIDLGDGQLSSQDESRLLEHYGLVASGDGSTESGEQRPASPWPDDPERETAWERPAQPREWPDTHDISQGREHMTADSGTPSQGQHQPTAPVQQRDTAPSPTAAVPAPPQAEAGRVTPPAETPAAPPAQTPPPVPTSPPAQTPAPIATPTAVRPAEGSGPAAPRPDADSSGSRT